MSCSKDQDCPEVEAGFQVMGDCFWTVLPGSLVVEEPDPVRSLILTDWEASLSGPTQCVGLFAHLTFFSLVFSPGYLAQVFSQLPLLYKTVR